jgi:hypothetical protein
MASSALDTSGSCRIDPRCGTIRPFASPRPCAPAGKGPRGRAWDEDAAAAAVEASAADGAAAAAGDEDTSLLINARIEGEQPKRC